MQIFLKSPGITSRVSTTQKQNRSTSLVRDLTRDATYACGAVRSKDGHDLLIARVVVPPLNEVQRTVGRSLPVHRHRDVVPGNEALSY